MNKVFALITAFIVALATFFGIFALNSCEVAHADEGVNVIYYSRYTEFVPYSPYVNGTMREYNNVGSLRWTYTPDVNTIIFDFYSQVDDDSYASYGNVFRFFPYENNQIQVMGGSLIRGSWVAYSLKSFIYYSDSYHLHDSNSTVVFYYNCSSNFDFSSIDRIRYFIDSDSESWCYNIWYLNPDSIGGLFRITIRIYRDGSTAGAYAGLNNQFNFSDRYVFLTEIDYESVQYQTGYSDGYNNGYNRGYSNGDADGYSTGWNRGFASGKAAGFSDGVNSANTYTFFGLISAVLDAPLKVFKGMLDFDVLGMNLSGFALSLFSVAMVIAIIRFILNK